VADLAWAGRRLELRAAAALKGRGLPASSAERAARELLAVQASDWAFLDKRRQAGDYPFQRATDHARALLEAIHSRDPQEPRLRNLAPDLSLTPLLAP
jgi:1,4-alpha-glucan branching enzyme